MKIHKEGYRSIFVVFILLVILNSILFYTIATPIINYILFLASFVFFLVIVYFFRLPNRKVFLDDDLVLAPADGTLVTIEEVEEKEYFNDKRKQVSIFMSPLNVHANWVPVSGKIIYTKYNPGKHLVAWHPKSSIDNERSTIVIQTKKGQEILVRQIAGAVARRIVTYPKNGDEVNQGSEVGFIKFGSRVDIFLPIEIKINVKINDKIIGNRTVLANLN